MGAAPGRSDAAFYPAANSRPSTRRWIRIDRTEIVRGRPADEGLLQKMSASIEERIREQAEHDRLWAIDSGA